MRASSALAPSGTLFGFIVFFLKKQWLKLLVIQIMWFSWSVDQTIVLLFVGKIIDGYSTYVGNRDNAWSVLKSPILSTIALWVAIDVTFLNCGIAT
jgi:hypothetical protein